MLALLMYAAGACFLGPGAVKLGAAVAIVARTLTSATAHLDKLDSFFWYVC